MFDKVFWSNNNITGVRTFILNLLATYLVQFFQCVIIFFILLKAFNYKKKLRMFNERKDSHVGVEIDNIVSDKIRFR